MPFFYVDWYYIVLVLPAVILSLWASAHVKSTFRRYSQVRNARGMTGAEAAMAVLRAHGVTDVRVEHVSGDLTDHLTRRTTSSACRTPYTMWQRPPQSAWRRMRLAMPCSMRGTMRRSISARPSSP